MVLNNTLLKDQWVTEEIKEEINENEYTTYQNLWNTAKAVLRGKFMVICAYIINTETSQINNLMMHLKLLDKQEQTNSKTNRLREIIKNNEIETKKVYKISRKEKVCFFEEINKIDKPLANMKIRGGKRPKLIKSKMKKRT
jgi:hypothetical protein